MDINCTNKCLYQIEGKCTLNELSNFTQKVNKISETDCPYCQNIE